MEKRLKKPQKPLGFSKTVVTRYLAPEPVLEPRRKTRNGAQPGRPSVRFVKPDADDRDDELAPVVALRTTRAMQPAVRGWLAWSASGWPSSR